MKFESIAVSSLILTTNALLHSQTHAFTLQPIFHVHNNALTSLTTIFQSASVDENTATNGRTTEEVKRELSSGRILEDGPVIDFGSVKDSTSTGEKALAQARLDYLNAVEKQGKESIQLGVTNDKAQQRLMGINDDVVKEVGREVGAFVTDNEKVQKCAAYLRSKAPKVLFEESPNTVHFSDSDKKELDILLQDAYEESGLVTEAFAKTFYLGTQLMPPAAQRAIWAVYVWCRRTDEIVDAPRSPEDASMLTDLSAWEIRLENLFKYGVVEDVLDLPLLDCKINYPTLPIEPFVDMIRGMLMDIPNLGPERYETFDELHLYCYRVAGTVGLMSMPIFGCADGFSEEEAK